MSTDEALSGELAKRDADQIAIGRWQESTGRKGVRPDTDDLVVWLLDQVDAKDAEIAELKRRAEYVQKQQLEPAIQRADQSEAARKRAEEALGPLPNVAGEPRRECGSESTK